MQPDDLTVSDIIGIRLIWSNISQSEAINANSSNLKPVYNERGCHPDTTVETISQAKPWQLNLGIITQDPRVPHIRKELATWIVTSDGGG